MGIITPSMTGWYFGNVIGGAYEVLHTSGYDLQLHNLARPEARDRFFDRMSIVRRVDAVISVGLPDDQELVTALRTLGLPVVVLGARAPGLTSVAIDDVKAARTAVRYRVAGQCAAVHGGGEGPRGKARQGPSRAPDGTVLLLDVLPHDGQRRAADGPGEGGAGPQALRAPVVPHEVGELLPQTAGGHALEAVDQLRHGDLGRVVDQRVHVVGLAGELDQLGLDVAADRPHDLFPALEVPVGEDVASVVRDEHQVRAQQERAASTGVDRCDGRSCRCWTVRCSCAAPVRLPPDSDAGSADRACAGVRVCAGGVQRRHRRTPGRP